ncbi:gliding motility-associated C-terminal domain-containing protein [Prevotella multiformis]|uniref:gliding motility-associated C-terminal domain-containing protein n=1 Tax=Prevotella multiformis TaxID=282402 RepID=UPI0023F48467|nr:gliding motility-associated C-terminal domain-containing protein [Prevotella multiformis]
MKPRKTSLLAAMLTILFSVSSRAQDCQPSGKFTDKEGEAGTIAAGETYAGSAPLTVTFSANPPSGHDPATNYEWHFFNQNNPREAYLIRYDEDTEYIFTEAGTTRVVLYEILNGDTTRYNAINVSISESSLQMPNAFSPNGDGINDVYRAKPGYKSIVSFKAVIFNRWGQKLYEWDDPAGGWDGKYKGRDVAQGTYFVNVTAKGADGREFRIRRDVNLLRGYTQAAH